MSSMNNRVAAAAVTKKIPKIISLREVGYVLILNHLLHILDAFTLESKIVSYSQFQNFNRMEKYII